MNEILPRIYPNGGGRGQKMIHSIGRYSAAIVGGAGSVLPRSGVGVSARAVLSAGGIKSGTLVRVKEWNREAEQKGLEEAARRRAEKEAEERRRQAAKAEAARREIENAKPITAEETRLADLLEAAQEMKPMADMVTEAVAEAETKPATIQAVIPEASKEDCVIPEGGGKKRRGRKGKKGRAAGAAIEQELL